MPDNAYYQAADAVLAALGITPSPVAVNLLVAWSLAEWGGTNDLAATNNPMATTQPEPGATNWNSAGVKIYPSLAVGAQATAQTLQGSYYATLLAGLRAGDPAAFFSQAGRYGLAVWAGGPGAPNYQYAAAVQSLYGDLGPPPAWATTGSESAGGTIYATAGPTLGLPTILVGIGAAGTLFAGWVLLRGGRRPSPR